MRLVFDNAGGITGSRDYSAFGAITQESGAGLDRYAYTAREWDATLKLQYNRERLYDPETGRFTREDPLGLTADINPFRYAGNAVTTYTDPSGLEPPSWWNRFGNRVRSRVGDSVGRFQNGLGQLTRPIELGNRFVSGAGEFGRRAETFEEKLSSGWNSLGTADGWQRAWDIYSGGASWWADHFANNSAESAADAALLYLTFRGPAVAADAAGVAAAYGEKLCLRQRVPTAEKPFVPTNPLDPKGTALAPIRPPITAEPPATPTRSASTGKGLLGAAAEGIATPYGTAVQEESAAALSVRSQIQQGATVYKGGVLGRSETGASQFLATESPLNPGYAGRYGLPPQNVNFDFIMGGRVRPGAPVITRSAPGIPPNPGGGIEGVINPSDFRIDWFHMPD